MFVEKQFRHTDLTMTCAQKVKHIHNVNILRQTTKNYIIEKRHTSISHVCVSNGKFETSIVQNDTKYTGASQKTSPDSATATGMLILLLSSPNTEIPTALENIFITIELI